MNMFKKLTLMAPAAVMVFSFATVTVEARQGSDDTMASPTAAQPIEDQSGNPTVQNTPETEAEHGTETEVYTASVNPAVQKEVQDNNSIKAKSELMDIEKTGKKKHADDERKKNCQGLQHGLETKLANLGKNAQKHQAHIDEILTKAEAYQASHNVAGLDDLIAQAKIAQTQSQASVTALLALTVKVDCNDPNVAQTVASFKAATTSAHQDLQAYRTSLKTALTAIEQAKDVKEGNQ